MKRLLILSALLSAGISDCGSLPYKTDQGLLSAVDGDAFEMKFKVNGLYCRDIEEKFGECVYSLREGSDLNFEFYLPPGPGVLRIFVPNRDPEAIPFRDQIKPLEWKLSSLRKSDTGFFGFSAILDDSNIGAIQGVLHLNVVAKEFEPLESPRIEVKDKVIEIIASPYSKWLALIVGSQDRIVLEKANKISFSREEGEKVEVECYSDILRSSYGRVDW